MPVSETATSIAQKPVSLAIKQALGNIEGAKTKKDEILRECVEMLANLNMVNELLEVHQGTK